MVYTEEIWKKLNVLIIAVPKHKKIKLLAIRFQPLAKVLRLVSCWPLSSFLVPKSISLLSFAAPQPVNPCFISEFLDTVIIPLVVAQLLRRVRLFATPWTAERQAFLSITISWSSLKLMSIKSVMPCSHLILCRPLLLLPQSLPGSVFSNESTLRMRWPKYWSFSFSIIPSKEIPGLISFRMDWLDLLSPRDSQESSPTPQFRSIHSSVLSLLHSPSSIHTWPLEKP